MSGVWVTDLEFLGGGGRMGGLVYVETDTRAFWPEVRAEVRRRNRERGVSVRGVDMGDPLSSVVSDSLFSKECVEVDGDALGKGVLGGVMGRVGRGEVVGMCMVHGVGVLGAGERKGGLVLVDGDVKRDFDLLLGVLGGGDVVGGDRELLKEGVSGMGLLEAKGWLDVVCASCLVDGVLDKGLYGGLRRGVDGVDHWRWLRCVGDVLKAGDRVGLVRSRGRLVCMLRSEWYASRSSAGVYGRFRSTLRDLEDACLGELGGVSESKRRALSSYKGIVLLRLLKLRLSLHRYRSELVGRVDPSPFYDRMLRDLFSDV